MLYQAYQSQCDLLAPWQEAARGFAQAWRFLGTREPTSLRRLAAAAEVFSQLRLTHERPPFSLGRIGPDAWAVEEEVMDRTPFATLLRFRKPGAPEGQPRMLVAAPLSGHFATLLRDTIRTLLQDHEVWVTDWHNARQVRLSEGVFGFDEYVQHLIRFLGVMGPGSHVMAVCQPCVPVLAAVALMAEDDHPAQPRTMTLMAGPVDTRINPTEVNKLAISKPMEWFEKNLICRVPLRYPGGMRRVYPGFLQLTAFMSMNPDRHTQAFQGLYEALVAGETDKAETTRTFYEEYFAVNDLPAEFYLETVERVFQTWDLARGVMKVAGRSVNTAAIRRTALFTVEGERDDICALGQTVAAHDLCSSLRAHLKTHHIQTGVGHYGVFSGRRWQQQIYPRVRELVHQHDDA